MSKKEKIGLIIVVILVAMIIYRVVYREHFEAELESKRTNERIDKLSSDIEALRTDFQTTGKKMESQSQQAAAMSATLQAMPTGFNPSPLPTV